MDWTIFNVINALDYKLDTFRNEFVKVEPAGKFIKVFVIRNGTEFSLLDLEHPFSKDKDFPKQRTVPVLFLLNCTFSIQKLNEDEVKIIFRRRSKRFWQKIKINVLTITCVNPGMTPKPIEVKWE